MSKEPRTAQTNIRSYHRERREWIEAANRAGLELGSWCRYHLNRVARESLGSEDTQLAVMPAPGDDGP